MSATPSTERRWGTRIEVDQPVRLDLARGRSIPGRMRDASVSGALIECTEELPVFTPVRVEIPAQADSGAAPIQMSARVVRAEHPCIGVEWRDIAPDAYTHWLQANGLVAQAL